MFEIELYADRLIRLTVLDEGLENDPPDARRQLGWLADGAVERAKHYSKPAARSHVHGRECKAA